MKKLSIDINCDMGESFGAWEMGQDLALMEYVSSVNVACGFHAGDPHVMRKTVETALERGINIGAHPGFPDLQGFGRRNMAFSPAEVYELCLYQIGALQAIVRACGGSLKHVKPHGALYNMAAKQKELASAIVKAVKAADPDLVLYGLSGSCLISAAGEEGLRAMSEVFSDRSYQSDGSLTPRDKPDALLEDLEAIEQHVLNMSREQKVQTLNGPMINIKADTICIHGDGKQALAIARRVYHILSA